MSIYLHPYLAALWVVSILLHFVLLGFLCRPSREKFTGFALYVEFTAIYNATLFAYSALGIGWPYTYVVWGGGTIENALLMAVVVELFIKVFAPVNTLPKWFANLFGAAYWLCLTVIIAFAVYFPSTQPGWWGVLHTIDRTETLIICTGVWAISAFSDIMKCELKNKTYYYALGLLFSTTIAALLSAWGAHLPGHATPIVWLPGFIASICSALVWIISFRKQEPKPLTADLPTLDQVREAVSAFHRAIEAAQMKQREL
jgi:hypothetical protein